jgi:hypothetical protein
MVVNIIAVANGRTDGRTLVEHDAYLGMHLA